MTNTPLDPNAPYRPMPADQPVPEPRPNLHKDGTGEDLGSRPQATTLDRHERRRQRRGERSTKHLWSGGGIFLFIGAFILLGQLGLSDRLWGVALFLPLVLALAATLRQYRSTGDVSGSIWWLFGSLFPAAAGLGRITGLDINYGLVVALGFAVIGIVSLLGLNRYGSCHRS